MSDCSCVYVDVDDPSDLWRAEIRTSRKEYKCVECGDIIKRKEKYRYASSLYDGNWSHSRCCLDCLSVEEAFFCSGYYIGALWSELLEHIADCWYKTPVEALAKLTPKAREKVCKVIEEQWAENEDDDE